MPDLPPDPVGRVPFEYGLVRVVPRVERGEGFNAGIILFCRARGFLEARLELDEELLRTFAADTDPGELRHHLDAIRRVCAGDPMAGPIAALAQPERFRWLTAKSSTVVQVSDVHAGLTSDPAASLDHAFRALVERPPVG